MDGKFLIPAEYRAIAPLVEEFLYKPAEFVEYVKMVRDESEDVGARGDLHELYRSLSVRALQAIRRPRLRRATVLITPEVDAALGRSTSFSEHTRISNYIEKFWGALRLEAMSVAREALKSKRLSTEEKSIVVNQFWAKIDQELDAGRVLLPGVRIEDIVKAIS